MYPSKIILFEELYRTFDIYIFQQKYHTNCHSFNGCNQFVLEC